ncbi:MAG TPA: S8 family serine peptidase, partial [Polyangiaceae bacterium]|nr:S8 family serine peptidase [Polyangiaceae bacterium]
MRRSLEIFAIGFVVTTAAACSGGSGEKSDSGQGQASPLTATLSAAASAPDRDMIVIMRDQMPNLTPGRGTRRVRSNAIASAHAPLIANLQATRQRKVQSFELANGFAAKLSQPEIDQLSANSQVLAVVPDRVIQKPKSSRRSDTAAGGSVKSANVPAADSLCNTLEPEALQLTNTAFLDTSKPQAQEVVDGKGVKVTGRGVTVGILADGFDPNIEGFTHKDGSKVFVDYQDFTGDPAGTPTAGGEMFGDASSIGAQDMPNGKVLNFDLSTFVNPAHPLPSPCNIRVRGVAPGASLVGLKVFSQLGFTTTSSFVQAIDYAVAHDDVDILNESFGGNGYPDDATDPISLANQAAVRSGVTVVVSTGDAGSNDTLGSPSTDNWVIASGATTSFRLYAQTGEGIYALANGFVDGNLSSFSSGGFAQKSPRTVDFVAPGDLGWALCSTNADLYQDCTDLNGNPAGVEIFGGTSESAPLTSGAAALVIQAYRSTHDGATPSPALVKRILMSTAADIGAPSDEQGSGFLDALKAVNTALSVRDENGAPAPRGTGFLTTPDSARITANRGDDLVRTFEITNTGATTLKAQPAIETLGAPFAGATLTGALNPATDPTYANVVGTHTPYTTLTFTVPAGADHLDAAIAWPSHVGGNAKLAAL